MTHRIIKWQCPHCNETITSKSKEHHQMDYCKCKKTACDLEEHYCRWMGIITSEAIKKAIISNEKDK